MLSPEEFSEGGAGVSNRPQSRVYKILTRTRYTTVTKTNQVIDCDRFENTRESHKDGHVGTTRAEVLSSGLGVTGNGTPQKQQEFNEDTSSRVCLLQVLQVQYSKLAKNS